MPTWQCIVLDVLHLNHVTLTLPNCYGATPNESPFNCHGATLHESVEGVHTVKLVHCVDFTIGSVLAKTNTVELYRCSYLPMAQVNT